MKHAYIDQYSNINSLINRVNPSIKVITLALFILMVIFTKPGSLIAFALYGILICVLILLSRIPLLFILKRSLTMFPFVLMTAMFIPFFKQGKVAGEYSLGILKFAITYEGFRIFWNILIKAYLSILCTTLLISSTKFYRLLKAFEILKIPKPIILILSFMYRYLFVVQDGLMKMKQAKESRCCCASKWHHLKTTAFIIANLFLKTYERAEAVYLAMCSRGFNSTIRTIDDSNLSKNDFLFLFIMITLLTGIKLWWG